MSRKRRREAREEARGGGTQPDPPSPQGAARWPAGERTFLIALPVLLVASAALRMAEAWQTFLAPDEALVLRIAQAPDFASVYRMTTEQAHPPLYFLLLHAWTWVATSDFALRMPSILAATAAVGLMYVWMKRKATPLAGLGAASLIALSPSIVGLTLEVRQYSFLLLFCTGALVAASPPTGLPTALRLAVTGGLLVAASATHYSGVLFAVSLLGAMLVELILRKAPRRLVANHLISSLAVGLFAGMLWWTHARALSGGALEAEAKSTWLQWAYWQPGDGFLGFAASAVPGVYEYLLGNSVAAVCAVFLAVVTVAVLARGDPAFASLLVMPFVVGLAAAALRVYPLGASRHSVWLLPTAAAAIALPLAKLKPQFVQRVVPVLAILAALWASTAGRSLRFEIPRSDRKQGQMNALLATISQRIDASDVVFVDGQTAVLLQRYMGGGNPTTTPQGDARFRTQALGPLNVWVSSTWILHAPTFVPELLKLKSEAGLREGQQVWVINAGPSARLLPEMASAYPRAPISEKAGFGRFLWLFRIAVP